MEKELSIAPTKSDMLQGIPLGDIVRCGLKRNGIFVLEYVGENLGYLGANFSHDYL